jgi:hypothetical protein
MNLVLGIRKYKGSTQVRASAADKKQSGGQASGSWYLLLLADWNCLRAILGGGPGFFTHQK